MKLSTILIMTSLFGLVIILIIASGCTEMGEDACGALSGRDRDHCYQNMAKITGNLELCKKVEGGGPASKCYAYVAGLNGEISTCVAMENMPWHHDTEAYRWQDCVMYAARTSNCPDFCDYLESYKGQATDLNPYMTVSLESCRKNINCGQSGQPACRTGSGRSVTTTGDSKAYYCEVDGVTTYFPTSRTC